MGSAFEKSGKRDVAAGDGQDLRVAARGEYGEAVAHHRHYDARDPQPQADPDRSGESAVDDRERAGGSRQQDRLGERTMHGRRKPGQIILH